MVKTLRKSVSFIFVCGLYYDMTDSTDEIKQVMIKYETLIPKAVFQRDLILPELKFDKANIIIGPRRSGKTYYLYYLINKLNPGYKSVYINFEDNRLPNLDKSGLNLILDCAKELYGDKLIFFLDEIQNIDNWENFIISLLNEHHKVYITGSNSKLLSKDIATSLRGKSLSYLLLPFSFSEIVSYKLGKLEKEWANSKKVYTVKKIFKNYFLYGGFPEVFLADGLEIKNKLINNYFESVLYKDLVERLNIKNIKLVEVIMKYVLNLFGNNFSISVFENYLKSNKIAYSLEDLYLILYSLQDVFLIYYLREYSKSYKKTEVSKSKTYLFDLGYIRFIARESEDNGRILENLVFIELYRHLDSINVPKLFFYKSPKGYECDFVLENNGKIDQAIQVTYNLDVKNKTREINGLLGALNNFNLKSGLILTYDQEEIIKQDNKTIYVKPVWKWLLE